MKHSILEDLKSVFVETKLININTVGATYWDHFGTQLNWQQ
jgi:hypothetical protein